VSVRAVCGGRHVDEWAGECDESAECFDVVFGAILQRCVDEPHDARMDHFGADELDAEQCRDEMDIPCNLAVRNQYERKRSAKGRSRSESEPRMRRFFRDSSSS
jgi:hypothetical protein